MEKSINFLSRYILKFGRTAVKESTLLLGWPGSGFAFGFIGNEFRIKFGNFNSERHFYFKITVDKTSQTHCVCASDQIVVVRGLAAGFHSVKVTRITECMDLTEINEITICGDNVSFSDNVSLPALKFEFIGDSITAGYGNMSEADAGIYRASEQDITYGYSHITATGLKADSRFICCSGKGVFNNWDGSKENRISDFYTQAFIGAEEKHDFDSWQPDLIFINAGTNDATAGTDPLDFKTAYIEFVEKVHMLNPTAHIICIYGVMTDKFNDTFEEIEKELGTKSKALDFKIEFIRFKTITPDFYGALGHPNSKAHARIARDLAKIVKRIIPRQ